MLPKKTNPNLLIFNPNAGKKRQTLTIGQGTTLEDVEMLLQQYQIPVDLAPTKHPGHATELARNAVKHKYSRVFVAGGDGTVGEVANGLVGSDMTMGIIPMGSVMNVATMLSIPLEIEKAIMLLKIGRCRKIDVGCIVKLDGKKVETPQYFLESAGIGLDAQFQKYFKKFEDGDFSMIWKMITTLFSFYKTKVTVTTDEKILTVRTTLISVANGPLTGASIPVAPDAKLNDHYLTVALYKLEVWDLIWYLWRAINGHIQSDRKQVEFVTTTKVKIESQKNIPLHVDARLFSKTPATFEVVPMALNVICGFPKDADSALVSKTVLDP